MAQKKAKKAKAETPSTKGRKAEPKKTETEKAAKPKKPVMPPISLDARQKKALVKVVGNKDETIANRIQAAYDLRRGGMSVDEIAQSIDYTPNYISNFIRIRRYISTKDWQTLVKAGDLGTLVQAMEYVPRKSR